MMHSLKSLPSTHLWWHQAGDVSIRPRCRRYLRIDWRETEDPSSARTDLARPVGTLERANPAQDLFAKVPYAASDPTPKNNGCFATDDHLFQKRSCPHDCSGGLLTHAAGAPMSDQTIPKVST